MSTLYFTYCTINCFKYPASVKILVVGGETMNLGIKIRHLRQKAKLDRKDLAKLLGISYSSISKYELGERLPDIIMLKKIAEFFDVSIDYLLDHTPSDKTSSLVAEENIFYGSIDLINQTAKLNQIDSDLIHFLLKLNELRLTNDTLDYIYKAFESYNKNTKEQ